MTKKAVKTRLPVILKKDGWFNTITDKYVSHAYAKRLNAYFLKYPDRTLLEMRGHAKYDPEKYYTEQSKELVELSYKTGTQIIKTKTLRGKSVYYSPFTKQVVSDEMLLSLKKLDYTICNGRVTVELYRSSRDKQVLCHVITVNFDQRLTNSHAVQFWMPTAKYYFNSMLRVAQKIIKKHPFGNDTYIYGQVDIYIYSDIDGFDAGLFIGKVTPFESRWLRMMKNDFDTKVLQWLMNRLEKENYHTMRVRTMTFYISGYASGATPLQREIAKHRIGIMKLDRSKK